MMIFLRLVLSLTLTKKRGVVRSPKQKRKRNINTSTEKRKSISHRAKKSWAEEKTMRNLHQIKKRGFPERRRKMKTARKNQS